MSAGKLLRYKGNKADWDITLEEKTQYHVTYSLIHFLQVHVRYLTNKVDVILVLFHVKGV